MLFNLKSYSYSWLHYGMVVAHAVVGLAAMVVAGRCRPIFPDVRQRGCVSQLPSAVTALSSLMLMLGSVAALMHFPTACTFGCITPLVGALLVTNIVPVMRAAARCVLKTAPHPS